MPIKKKEAGCPVAGRKRRTLSPGKDRDLSPSFGGGKLKKVFDSEKFYFRNKGFWRHEGREANE
jgi:hypothetical protein